MEKSMYYKIQNKAINDYNFHANLVGHINDLNEKILEEKFPGIKIGPIISIGAYLDRGKIKRYISEMNELNEILQKDIFPGIKFNFAQFTKN